MWIIICAIPDDREWRQARQFCLQDNIDLAAVFTTLQSYERPITDTTGPVTAGATAILVDSGSEHFTKRSTSCKGSKRAAVAVEEEFKREEALYKENGTNASFIIS